MRVGLSRPCKQFLVIPRPCKHRFLQKCRRPCKQLLPKSRPCNNRELRLTRLRNNLLHYFPQHNLLQTLWPSRLRGQGSAIRTLISPWHFVPTCGYLSYSK